MRPIVLGTISIDRMAGGLEKNIVWLANYLVNKGHVVHLVTFDCVSAESFYSLSNDVIWHKVGSTQPHSFISFSERFDLIKKIRAVLKSLIDPAIICFHHGILPRFFLASFGLGIDIICSERNSLTLYNHVRQKKWTLGFVMLSICKRVSVQFNSYKEDYPFWLRSRIRVINNPVSCSTQALSKPEKQPIDGRFKIILVGRLCAQKNQLLLLDAFTKLAERFSDWDLHYVGDGELEHALWSRVEQYGLQNRVFLNGKSTEISTWLTGANMFCFPSKWEGFPNALAEAMSAGLPCIGLNTCAGVRDLIQHGDNGFLASDEDLHKYMEILMTDSSLRLHMGSVSRKIISQYTPERSFELWDSLLDEITY